MKKLFIISILFLLFACNSKDYYHEEINGNTKTVTRRIKDKIGEDVQIYEKIKVIKLRIDDDAEYHITYKLNNRIYNESDICDFHVSLSDGDDVSWKNKRGDYQITYPINKIVYFED
jgi:flavodoxin